MTDRFPAVEYAAFRPAYPAELIACLAGLAPARTLAWDCATGNGQAAVQLADHFERVFATDASPEQLSRAPHHARIDYRVAAEDDAGVAAASVDLVTVAQALHWLDRPRFFREVRRVLKPRGVVAAWCYGRVEIAPDVDGVMDWFDDTRMARFRARDLGLMRDGYRDVEFPFDDIPCGPWMMSATMTLESFLGFVGSWSAVASERREAGVDPVADLKAALLPFWQAGSAPRGIRWPIAARVGRGPA